MPKARQASLALTRKTQRSLAKIMELIIWKSS